MLFTETLLYPAFTHRLHPSSLSLSTWNHSWIEHKPYTHRLQDSPDDCTSYKRSHIPAFTHRLHRQPVSKGVGHTRRFTHGFTTLSMPCCHSRTGDSIMGSTPSFRLIQSPVSSFFPPSFTSIPSWIYSLFSLPPLRDSIRHCPFHFSLIALLFNHALNHHLSSFFSQIPSPAERHGQSGIATHTSFSARTRHGLPVGGSTIEGTMAMAERGKGINQ